MEINATLDNFFVTEGIISESFRQIVVIFVCKTTLIHMLAVYIDFVNFPVLLSLTKLIDPMAAMSTRMF